MVRIHHLAWLLLAICCLQTACHTSPPPDKPVRIVYHINYDNIHRQLSALRSIGYQLDSIAGQSHDIRVVLHGRGISMLLEPDALADTRMAHANATPSMQVLVSGLKEQGVRFFVDRHTLKEARIDYRHDLYDVDAHDLVDDGILEIVRLQKQGFQYIKP